MSVDQPEYRIINQNLLSEAQTVTGEMVVPRITSQAYFSQQPLAAGAKVSTDWMDLSLFDSFSFFFNSDKDGRYTIEYSNDMVNLVTPAIETDFIAANGRRKGALDPDASYVRIGFTNTSSQAQTMFTISVWAKVGLTQASLETLGAKGATTRLGQWVKAILQIPNDAGLYDDLHRIGNALLVHIDNPSEATATDVSLLAKESTLGNILTALGNVSKDTTLSSILAKIITSPSTEAKQDAANVLLAAIRDKDFASQTTLTAVLTLLGNGSQKTQVTNSDYAKEAGGNLAAILTKISSDPASQTTLLAILTILGNGNQKTLITNTDYAKETGGVLASILAKLSADPATQTTLAAMLTVLQGTLKVNTTDVSSLAKESGGNLVAILNKLTSDPATQATLAAVLAKISADPSTATLQNAMSTLLGAINTKLGGTLMVASIPTTTGGYPSKEKYLPSGAGGAFKLIATGVRKLGTLIISNTSTSVATLMIYDKATAPVSGDTSIHDIIVQGNSTVSIPLGDGMHFNNGIGFGAASGNVSVLGLVAALLNSLAAGSLTVNYSYI